MNAQEQNRSEERLQATLTAAYPADEPSEELRRRVGAITGPPQKEPLSLLRQRRQIRLALASMALMLVPLVLMRLPLTAARALEHMAGAMRDAKSAHAIQWHVAADGSRTKISETWYDAGRWRVDKPGGSEICADGKRWHYQPSLRSVLFDRGAMPRGYDSNATGFSLASFIADAAKRGVHMNAVLLGETTYQGQTARQIALTDEKQPGQRHVLLVDTETDLPLYAETQHNSTPEGGRWQAEDACQMDYNQAIPTDVFAPDFPPATRLIDLEVEREEWRTRLAKGVAQAQVGSHSVVVRDLEVTAQGDVFVLYTAKSFPQIVSSDGGNARMEIQPSVFPDGENVRVELQDDFGTRYLARNAPEERFVPVQNEQNGQNHGYVFDGESLQGRRWIPVRPEAFQQPRRLTLTFRWADQQATTVTLQVKQLTGTSVPQWWLYAEAQDDGWRLSSIAAVARADFYRDAAHDLSRALAWYREGVRLDFQEEQRVYGANLGFTWRKWLCIADLEEKLGHPQEAHEATVNAYNEVINRHGPDSDVLTDEMKARFRREGLPVN